MQNFGAQLLNINSSGISELWFKLYGENIKNVDFAYVYHNNSICKLQLYEFYISGSGFC